MSRVIVGCELARVSLKIHAYFREKLLYGFPEAHEEYIYFKPSRVKEIPIPPNINIENF